MILLDCIIAIMLGISILYSWQLNKKIQEFRQNKQELATLIHALNNAIIKAATSIEELKTLSCNISDDLNTKIEKGQFLTDDLAFMNDRASILADKLEGIINLARHLERNNIHSLRKAQSMAQDKNGTSGINPPDATVNNDPVANTKHENETKKVAIESLLARISATQHNINKKEKAET